MIKETSHLTEKLNKNNLNSMLNSIELMIINEQ